MDKIKLEKIAYILGMPRAGTTFLYHNLQKHPQIYVPFRRKSNYFSLHTGKPLEWFLDHFKDAKSEQLCIDTETLYFLDKNLRSYEKIHQLNPDAKVMLFVRNPAEWAWSLYKQIATFDKNIVSFEQFLAGGYMLLEDGKEIPFNYKNGDIEKTIKALMRRFEGNLMIVDFKLFTNDPLRILKEIEIFLDLPDFFIEGKFDNKRINASDRKHFTFLALLLRNKLIINTLSRLPGYLVVFIRGLYDIWGTLGAKKNYKYKDSEKDQINKAKNAYSKDVEYISELFLEYPVLKF